jgi:uncharacterized membrane protein YesL
MAGFFGLLDYNKEGPGVSKNAPQKRRFVVFFEIYSRKFWQLMIAGLLHTLVALPQVTKGLADAGLTFITRNFSREKHAFVREDFFETIRKNRGPALAFGIINLLVTGLLIFNLYYYLFGMMPGLYALFGVDVSDLKPMEATFMDNLVMAATGVGFVIFSWMKYYIPFMVVTFKLRLKQVYKNAFIFAVAGLKANLIISAVLIAVYALLVSIALFIPNVLALLFVALLWLLLVPAFRSLLIQYTIFPTVKKLMIDPYYKENPQADKQARIDLNLDVEEDTSAQAAEEPVFADEPLIPEKADIPKQYSEQEMRGFRRRVQNRDEDDDTI